MSGFAPAALLGWTPGALGRIAELRGWTEQAIERLGLEWNDGNGRPIGIPVRDATADRVGTLRYDPTGHADPKMRAEAGGTRELFPPPEMIGDQELVRGLLLLTEGEPDTVAAWSHGFAAVGVPGVQGWKPEYAARFSGRRWTVCVSYDCDDGGREKAPEVAASLAAAGVDVRLVDLDPTHPHNEDDHYDLTDFLRERGADALRELLEQTSPYVPASPGADESTDPTVPFAGFVERVIEGRDPIVTAEQGTMLPPGGLVILVAKTGDGKTTMTVEFVLHASAGLDYLGLSFPRPLRVLVIENEGPREAFREKLEARLATWDAEGDPRIWDEPAEWGTVRISDPATRERLRAVIEEHRIDLIVSDSLTRFGVRGNGTPEETREFVEWLTDLGLGRDVAFLLLHHPRTRPEHGEDELERIAGAWPPHCDLILLLKRYDGNRARLSFPKARWTRGQRPPCILAFDATTESFTYVGVDEAEQRDYAAELAELLADGEPRAKTTLRKKKEDGGIGADWPQIDQALTDERFAEVAGDTIGKRKGTTYYVLREASAPPDDGHDATTVLPEGEKRRPSSPREKTIGDDASLGPHASRDDDPEAEARCGLCGDRRACSYDECPLCGEEVGP